MKVVARGGAGNGRGSSSSSAVEREELQRYQQDLALLAQKISDLSPDHHSQQPQQILIPPAQSSSSSSALSAPSSPFVSGLRGMAAAELERGGIAAVGSNGGTSDEKLRLIERVLLKIQELDRIVLKKTAPPQPDIVQVLLF